MSFCFHRLEPRWLLSAPYEIQDLGSLGGDSVVPKDINEHGVVVGEATGPDGESHAFMWSECDGIRDLFIPSFRGAFANAINDKGQVVGAASYDAGLVNHQAFIYSNGKVEFLARPHDFDNNYAIDINNTGEVLTWEYSFSGADLGGTYLYSPSLQSFSYVAIGRSEAINNSGIIAGPRKPDSDEVNPTFSSRYVQGTDINDNGIVVSRRWEGSDSVISVRDSEGLHEFIEYQANASVGEPRINNLGTMIGSTLTTSPDSLAFGWIRDGNLLRDLNSLIPKNSGWQIVHANAINDKGQIVGDGIHNGQKRGFLLNPTGAPLPTEAGQSDIHLEQTRSADPQASGVSKRRKQHHQRPARHVKPAMKIPRSLERMLRSPFYRLTA